MIFGIKTHKKGYKYAKKRELSGWKDMVVWKDFRLLYVLKAIWAKYI